MNKMTAKEMLISYFNMKDTRTKKEKQTDAVALQTTRRNAAQFRKPIIMNSHYAEMQRESHWSREDTIADMEAVARRHDPKHYHYCCENMERACFEGYFWQPVTYDENKNMQLGIPMLGDHELPPLRFPHCPWCQGSMSEVRE